MMQGVVSWRCFEWGDLFYNVIGVVAAWAILVLGRRLGLSIPGIDFLDCMMGGKVELNRHY